MIVSNGYLLAISYFELDQFWAKFKHSIESILRLGLEVGYYPGGVRYRVQMIFSKNLYAEFADVSLKG